MSSGLFVTEYAMLGWVGVTPTQLIQAPAGPPLAEQNLAVGVISVPSSAFSANTKFIRVVTTIAANLAFGVSPIAVITAHYLPVGSVVYYAVAPGSQIAVIANS